MSENLSKLFTTQFSTILLARLAQHGSKLRDKVMTGMHVGKQASPVQYLSPIQMRAPTGRFAPLGRSDADFMRRWVFPQEGEINQLLDSFEQLETIIDPKSQYSTNAADAVGRAWDDAVIAAAFGTAQTGQDASAFSAETFATANTTATGSSTGLIIADTYGNGATTIGLTVDKLIECRRIFRHVHVDLEAEMLSFVMGSTQEADLLRQVQVVSTEFNDRPVLTDGRVTKFLGWNMVPSERLSYASSIRSCIAFVKSGLYLGMWKDLSSRVSVREDLSSQPYQVYTNTMFGATRLEPGRVLQVKCSDAVTGDNV